jgi:hypothetical protein
VDYYLATSREAVLCQQAPNFLVASTTFLADEEHRTNIADLKTGF